MRGAADTGKPIADKKKKNLFQMRALQGADRQQPCGELKVEGGLFNYAV